MANNNEKKRINGNVRNNGSYIFSDFSKGLYLLDTPRGIGEQLSSLALIGGRNVWSEKGAMVSQHGYIQQAQVDLTKKIVGATRTVAGTNSFFLVTLDGEVFRYSASQGLKKFKTAFSNMTIDPVVTRRGEDLIIFYGGNSFLLGGYYEESDNTIIVSDLPVQDFGSYYQVSIPLEYADFFWNDKSLAVTSVEGTFEFTVLSVVQEQGGTSLTLRMMPVSTSVSISGNISLGEKTKLPITLTFNPDNNEPNVGAEVPVKDPVNLTPVLMEVSNNRLFVVHIDGNIYYSQIGNINSFNQAQGAGFFGGFYQDTSKTLSIEEFLEGTLITKENGIYYLTIGSTLEIKKISQVGQQYPTDHVIVGEKVYAFDTNSGAIVNAVSVNVFGAMVSGKPVVTSEFLNAENAGINSSKRVLTYNAESEVFILYYGEYLNKGIVLTSLGTLFPRELDKRIETFIGFNQGVVFITDHNEIIQDFKKGSVIPELSCVAVFEPIGLRDNRVICSSVLEVTELNGIDYNVTTENSVSASQHITPSYNLLGNSQEYLPPLLYSDDKMKLPSYELTSKWAEKQSNVTRIYSPMSGRNGVSITIEFPANTAFCLSALRLPDFCQGN